MALKAHQWINPNKMRIKSGFGLFDKQTVLITTGNVIAETQYSNYIRPWKEVKNYSYIGKPGEFTKYDMQHFSQVPERIRKVIYDTEREKSVILYEFSVRHKDEKEIIGHVLTTGYDEGYKHIDHSVYCPYGCSYWKRQLAIHEAMRYICDDID